jgi:hypothetical protein
VSAPATSGPRVSGSRDTGGFALTVVVFLLFAIGVAAAAGYQVVQTEAKLSSYSRDAGKALAIAHAGLRRYLATLAPPLSDTTQYLVDEGEALVWARQVYDDVFPAQTWLITSRGEYGDPAATEGPARRTVRQFATLRLAPLDVRGVFANTGAINLGGGTISGSDAATSGQCRNAPRPAIAQRFQPGSISPEDVLDTLNVPWSALTDPAFPVDYANTWPPLGLPADVYPVVRFDGDLDVASLGLGGLFQRRGILIVKGQLTLRSAFRWDGIILAGRLASPLGHPLFFMEGLLVGGLTGPPANVTFTSGSMRYHSCKVVWAGSGTQMLQTRAKTWTEVF